MTILTIGPSPHLNNSFGKLHKSLFDLKSEYYIESISTLYDISYFLPNQSGEFKFDGINIHPFLGEDGSLSAFCMHIMKRLQPNIVITIAGRKEHDFMSAIKSVYPNLFKWIAIVPTVGPFSSDIYELNLADSIITTNQQSYISLINSPITNTKVYNIPFGGDSSNFIIKPSPRDFSAIYCCKNTIESNLTCFLQSVILSSVPAYLHYNIDDPGIYNIEHIINRLKGDKCIDLPKNFVSLKEGLSDNLMNDIYNNHFLVLDCSMQPKTGVSIIEGMLAGCIPIGPNFGAVGDIINSLPDEYKFFIPHETIMWEKQEEAVIVLREGLSSIFREIKHKFMTDIGWRENAAEKMREKALDFSKENFIKMIKRIIENVMNQENVIHIDSY